MAAVGSIDDSGNIQTCDDSSIFGRLSLRIIKVSWDGNHGMLNILA